MAFSKSALAAGGATGLEDGLEGSGGTTTSTIGGTGVDLDAGSDAGADSDSGSDSGTDAGSGAGAGSYVGSDMSTAPILGLLL